MENESQELIKLGRATGRELFVCAVKSAESYEQATNQVFASHWAAIEILTNELVNKIIMQACKNGAPGEEFYKEGFIGKQVAGIIANRFMDQIQREIRELMPEWDCQHLTLHTHQRPAEQ